MKTLPFFSFIIPVYNVENYLKECVESVLNQSFENYEIILIDDGSTDSSLNICNHYKKIDERVKVIRKKNEGLAETRNRGLEDAKGEYIIFLDSDDHLEKTGKVLLDLYLLLKDKKLDILLFNLTPFILNDDLSYEIYKIPSRKNIGETSDISVIFDRRLYSATACNKIIKRKLIRDEELKFPKGLLSEDIKWCGDLLKSTKNILFYPTTFYFYRQNRIGSITYETSKKNIQDIISQLESHFKVVDNSDEYVNEFYAFYYLICIKLMSENNNFSLNEIIKIMYPMRIYLKLSNEKRIVIFRNMVKIIGFKNTIKIIIGIFRSSR